MCYCAAAISMEYGLLTATPGEFMNPVRDDVVVSGGRNILIRYSWKSINTTMYIYSKSPALKK